MLQPQISRPQGNRLRDPFGYQSGFYASQVRQRDGGAIMRVEALGLHSSLTDDAEAAFAAVLAGVLLGGKLSPGWRRKQPNGPIRQYSIHIEQQQLDLAGAFLGHGRMIAPAWWRAVSAGDSHFQPFSVSSWLSRWIHAAVRSGYQWVVCHWPIEHFDTALLGATSKPRSRYLNGTRVRAFSCPHSSRLGLN